ncbi:MAG TPA: DUF167 domain-containing protein [Candidatus Paceibacterota bacterium]|nr:DUF167 domain-containing protein [Candidatus Paceibacterota bacterium]
MYIKVRVQAGANKEKVEKKSKDHYNIVVKEPAERNLANNRVCEIVAALLGVKRDAVRIINGHQSPSKLLSITLPE